MVEIRPIERRLCAFVETYRRRNNGISPSYAECGVHLGFTKAGVCKLVDRLERVGLARRTGTVRARSLTLTPLWDRIRSREFDRETNPMVAEVVEESPELFRDFTDDDWDQLYSMRGMGGSLTREGVVRAAREIPENRLALEEAAMLLVNGSTRDQLLETIQRLKDGVTVSLGRGGSRRTEEGGNDECDVSRDHSRGRRRRERVAAESGD